MRGMRVATRVHMAGTLDVAPARPIGLVPARGGSKGIRGKNLQPVAGRPLLVHAIRLCQQVCSRVIVSTDDPAISAVALFAGAELVGRPDHLASDEATVDQVCRWLQTIIPDPARLLVVQPTVPQVKPHDLKALAAYTGPAPAVCAVVEEPHILWLDGQPLTPRLNRQNAIAWPQREIGVRLYQPGHWGEPPSDVALFCGPVVDIDTPADLAAVRAHMESRTVLFRVLGNHEKGSGHLHRCLALAERMQHHQIGFQPVESDGLAETLIRRHGWPVWSEMRGADLIVNDTLDTTIADMARLLTAAPVVALEDLGVGADLASWTVNDMYGWRGPRLAVVRPEFLAVPDQVFGGGRVLVTFGGTDPAGLTERVVPLLAGLDVRVVAPPGRDGQWRNLAEDMAWADLIVTSGGRTVWECMAARRPCVTVLQNAREATHRHLELGRGVVNLGLAGLVSDETISGTIRRLASSPATLTDLASRMVGVVDGRGADRIVRECERIMDDV